MCTIPRKEAAWRRGARGKKRRGGADKRKKLRVPVWHGIQEMPVARARLSRTGKQSDFTTLNSRALGAVQRTLGVGGCGNIYFGHVLVAVRLGQRRDAVATGEEQLGKCAARKSK
jgi:hypothetical protein